ncbi:hypothetical protein Q4519_11975 [Motilimonas sp. 1_MG-2023]|uniref:hypothetical protein n=1 Tax=Motilimonas sp. 1_MG-2023 TaxID=3062672 RepID=UPI0026E1B0B3|nr:hypothetical protein [Motilimonas sp. 1_MG-2023]MDO6526400.1 hypothetical protein [Motilimonas sp. 1_MG-2023]
MKFSLPQNNFPSLTQLIEQANLELESTGTINQSVLTTILDACFSSGFNLVEIEKALQCEVDDLESVNKVGLNQLIDLINYKIN